MNKNQGILLNLFMFLLLLFSCSEDGLTVKKSELDVTRNTRVNLSHGRQDLLVRKP